MAELNDHARPPDGDWPVVRAEVLAVVCTDESAQLRRMGVQVQGVLVEGDLDLRWAQLRCPLRLEHCWLPARIMLADAHGKELVLITARSARVLRRLG